MLIHYKICLNKKFATFFQVIDGHGKLGTKIDWHDWEMVGADLRRQGPGENGAAVKLTTGKNVIHQ